jgi:uncharacterized membrane protein
MLIHLRNKITAGVLTAVPLVVIAVGVIWAEEHTRPIARALGLDWPGLGVLMAVTAVYVLGVFVTSAIGGFVLYLVDAVLEHIPGLKMIYRAGKDVLSARLDKAGTFHKTVLVPVTPGGGLGLAFTSGESLPGDPASCIVFLPGAPNPMNGRLTIYRREVCLPAGIEPEEAFKVLLSNGNYLPGELAVPAANDEKQG